MKDTIVFDIDGVLADCSHRVHFLNVNPLPKEEQDKIILNANPDKKLQLSDLYTKPDWDAFYDACSEDKPIEDNARIIHMLSMQCHSYADERERINA